PLRLCGRFSFLTHAKAQRHEEKAGPRFRGDDEERNGCAYRIFRCPNFLAFAITVAGTRKQAGQICNPV
ncbi:MAG: hypothetical protein ACREB7_10065, partial [Sphingopyxis sp.]|uniref:hypothetical protein n=1 Tax=Sphingopyxis sp. TaxID=1908224 RepID=UPI003D6C9A5F